MDNVRVEPDGEDYIITYDCPCSRGEHTFTRTGLDGLISFFVELRQEQIEENDG